MNEAATIETYTQQLVDQGGAPDKIDVIISGVPDLGQNEAEVRMLGEFEFTEEAGTSCVVAS